MKPKDFNIRKKVIEETFNDKRNIKCALSKDELNIPSHIHQEGEIFKTEDGEFIILEFQLKDFTVDELVKYVELAECLYEQHGKYVTIYLICPKNINVCVRECDIKSRAGFTIKLACIQEDPLQVVLNSIKSKIRYEGFLDGDDLHALAILPDMCKKEDRKYYLKEYLKIINMLEL